MAEIAVITAPAGAIYSCNACPWSGKDPDVTNGSLVVEDQKRQFWAAVCPVCGSYVAPESVPLVRRAS